MRHHVVKGIALVLLYLLAATPSAQAREATAEEERLAKEEGETRRKELEFEQIFAAQIKKTKDTDPFLDALLPYIAFRKQDATICRTSHQAKLCQDKYKWLQSIRNFAQGNCAQVNNNLMKKICQNLSQNTCASLPTGEADICQGYLQMDLESVRKGIGEPALKSSFTIEGNTKRAAAKMLSVYAGFKNYNSRFACLKYRDSLNLEQVLACDILFGDEDPYQTLDVIIRDIAMFDLSLMRDDMDLCSGISTQDIKNRCQNPKTRTQRLR
ncbi:MAG: hypothetical protein PHH75_05710 [Candidatus Omnitrophica bacterium]|nr:hypothetical protein [Candidatus Omnitrophota bacterium]MDD5574657.1 hypothetical protein [Candidatus Omnitrophota bacterium]